MKKSRCSGVIGTTLLAAAAASIASWTNLSPARIVARSTAASRVAAVMILSPLLVPRILRLEVWQPACFRRLLCCASDCAFGFECGDLRGLAGVLHETGRRRESTARVYGCIGSAPTPLSAIADLTDQPPLHADHSSIAEAHIARSGNRSRSPRGEDRVK